MKGFSFVFILIFMIAVSTAFCYTIQVDPLDLQISTVKIPSFGAFSSLDLKKASHLPVKPGEPQLPCLPVNLAIPQGMEIDSVQVNYKDPVNLEGYYLVLPQQEDQSESEKPQFTPPNPKIYSSLNPFPGDLVWSFNSCNTSGYQMGSIAFAPVQYVPLTGQLIIYREIDFSVTYRAQRMATRYPKERLRWVDDFVREAVLANVINPEELSGPSSRLVENKDRTEAYPYLILTVENLEQSANDLAYWKTKKGLNAKVKTVEDIANEYNGDDIQDKIRNCIIDYYENYSTIFVCIIDDETNENLPMREVYNPCYDEDDDPYYTIPTDNYYSCLDGNWNANANSYYGEWYPNNVDEVDYGYDIFIGRLSTVDNDTLDIVNNKIACYEGTSLSNETNPYNYQNNVLLAGAWLGPSTNLFEDVMVPIEEDYLTSEFWSITELGDHTYQGSGQGICFNPTSFISNMNDGFGIIAHGSHCGQNWIGTNYAIYPYYSGAQVFDSDIIDLVNQPNYTGIMYSLGCYGANPDYDTNCATNFLTAPYGGGVGYIGNARYGQTTASICFEKEFFHQLCELNVFANGRTLAFHKQAWSFQVNYPDLRYVYYVLYLSGDPDIWVPNDTIEELTVTYDNSINTGTQDYSLNVQRNSANLEGALVCVWKGEEVYASGKTNSNGNITFRNIDPSSSGTMYLTVTAANSETFEANITVGSREELRLLSFNTKRNTKGIQISWLIKASFPVEGFNLYRRRIESNSISVDSKGKMKFKTEKAKKLGTGNSKSFLAQGKWEKINDKPITGKNPYQYLDRTALGKEKYEYQLVIMNKKHSALLHLDEDYLGIATVDAGSGTEDFQLKIAPNPARTNIQLLLTLPTTENSLRIILYDLSGRKINEWSNINFVTGENQFSIPVDKLANGVYQLKLIGNVTNLTKNIIIMH